MIQQGFTFIAFLMFFLGTVLSVTRKYPMKFYKYFPPILIIYVSTMLFYTYGLWEMNEEITMARATVRDNLVPAMIFLMSLKCNIKDVAKLGGRLIFTFLSSSATIFIGFVVAFILFRGYLLPDTALAFGTIGAGWMGGTQNFLAVKEALDVSGDAFTYTLLMGNINYSIWIMILVGVASYKELFNSWTKTDTSNIEKLSKTIVLHKKNDKETDFIDLLFIIGMGFLVSALSQYLAIVLPVIGFINASIWKILIATVIGLALALTKVGNLRGIKEISNIILYIIIILVAANVNIGALVNAPMYVITGLVILIIHGVLMMLIAKIFKLDLYTCGIASIANIGGVASAPIIAAVYDDSLVSISVLMGMLGAIIGTFGGLAIANVLLRLV